MNTQNVRQKTLFIIDRMSIGGAPAVVMSHLRALDRTRFDPWLMTLYPSKPANFLPEARQLLGSNRVVEFKLWHRSPFDVVTLWRMYRFLLRERFDVVVTHLFLGNLIGRSLAMLAHVPRIISFEHSRYAGKLAWQVLADRILARHTYRIVVANEETRDFTSTQEHIPLSKFSVIPNPVPALPKYDEILLTRLRSEWGVPDNRVVFLALGRFSEEKGHETLIRAVALAAGQVPNIFVLIVGHGARKNALNVLVSELHLENHCRIVEDPLRARYAYYLADVYVLSSLREGFSIGMREAISAGLPVIASNLPTLRSIIEDNVSGLLFPPEDAEALAYALIRCVEDINLRKHMAAEMKSASQRFNDVSPVKEFEALLV